MIAIQEMCFKYQMNEIFSIPIATTPAAEPINNIEPPVPAVYAIRCHKLESLGNWNMPILAATSGTLSITEDAKPRRTIKDLSEIDCATEVPKFKIIPLDSIAAIVINIPRKNKTDGILIKLPKKKQDLRMDLPTIGLKTLKDCKKYGLKGIVLKSKKNIFLDKTKCISFANKNKIFIKII